MHSVGAFSNRAYHIVRRKGLADREYRSADYCDWKSGDTRISVYIRIGQFELGFRILCEGKRLTVSYDGLGFVSFKIARVWKEKHDIAVYGTKGERFRYRAMGDIESQLTAPHKHDL